MASSAFSDGRNPSVASSTSTGNGPAQGGSFLPSISLPKGGGAIRGMGEKFAANPVTAAGSITVPIPTSPGKPEEPRLSVENLAVSDTLTCDRRLLLRVLENLLRNAVEACPECEPVRMTFETLGHHSLLRVHHPGVMSSEVAARLFSALFSTKGPGRGLGMYSVQVLGEYLLGGQVSWDSSEPRGTTFLYSLPNSRQ